MRHVSITANAVAIAATITLTGFASFGRSTAGEWSDDRANNTNFNSPDELALENGPGRKWSVTSTSESSPSGGSCSVHAWAHIDTLKAFFGTFSQTAQPKQSWAKGTKAKIHKLPSHGQGAVQGFYRASADFTLSYKVLCTASGASAIVAGGGSANGSCAMTPPGSYTISIPNIGCSTSGGQEYGLGITFPGGSGINWQNTTAQTGKYDSGGSQDHVYFYKIADTPTYFHSLFFPWHLDASARMTSNATPGWLISSRAEGEIDMEATVSNVTLEVTDGPPAPPGA